MPFLLHDSRAGAVLFGNENAARAYDVGIYSVLAAEMVTACRATELDTSKKDGDISSFDGRPLLAKFKEELAAVEPFAARSLEAALKRFVESQDIKIGQIIHALRVAVTGKGVGFGMFETLEILGRDRCLKRIEHVLEVSG